MYSVLLPYQLQINSLLARATTLYAVVSAGILSDQSFDGLVPSATISVSFYVFALLCLKIMRTLNFPPCVFIIDDWVLRKMTVLKCSVIFVQIILYFIYFIWFFYLKVLSCGKIIRHFYLGALVFKAVDNFV